MSKLKTSLSKQPISSSFIQYICSKPSLLRLGGSLLLSAIVALLLIRVSHFNYWNRTIFRTQTVDFNILANMLPTKLSILMLTKEEEELQRTIDSNYGLFGIVVTDCQTIDAECPEQEILYISDGKVVKSNSSPGSVEYRSKGKYSRNWQSKLSEPSLLGNFYEPLRNPAPLTAEFEFENPRGLKLRSSGRVNTGDIIGRVYFLRNSPPEFLPSLIRWVKNPLSLSSAVILYNAIALATILTSVIVWVILESKYYKAALAEQIKNEAEKKVIKTEAEVVRVRAERAEAENKALRLKALWDGFSESFDQDFSSVIANQIEELRGFFRRLDTDIDNIVHDVRKAPLLTSTSKAEQIARKLESRFRKISDSEKQEFINSTVNFLIDTDSTIQSIQWVLDDLRQVANIDAEIIDVEDTIKEFLDNKPPYVKFSSIKIDLDRLDRQDSEPLLILCNKWHLRSIVKNVLYNCAAALSNYQAEQMFLENNDFQGEVNISCFREQEQVCIQIKDNGSGYPESILDKLYQKPEIVSRNPGGGRGGLIVYSYLKLHSGTAKIKNNSEGGGQVRFYFPSATSAKSEDPSQLTSAET